MVKIKKIILISLFLINANNALASDNVAIFKNGSGFFTKELQLNVKENIALVNDIPDALFGTIWFSSNNNIKSVKSEVILSSYKAKVGTLIEIINANINKKAKVTLLSGDSYEIKIEKTENELLFFRLKNNLTILNLNSIKMLEFIDQANYEFTKTENKRVMKIEFIKSTDKQSASMMYMQKDISWIPSYFIDLQTENTAKITLTANVINDSQDITNSDISLVVGVPSFIYSYLKSPLTSNQEINEFLRALDYNASNYGNTNNYMGNIMNQSPVAYQASSTTPANYQDEFKVSEQEDLYFYKLPKMNFKKGSRAIFDLFKAKIKYDNVYEVELESNQNKNYYASEQVNKIIPPKVWHYINFNNTTNFPFTTGTAMITRSDNNVINPISQNKLDYTPRNAKAKLKLTLSPDISVDQNEKEISRVENIQFQDGNYYDKQKIEAKISIKNSKTKKIKLNIKRLIEGKLEASNYKWENSSLSIYKTQNKINQVEWDIQLNPKESKEIIYNYSSFIKR